ncbi:MAG TPA: glycine cleavage system aminomethyltransferase GcvT [Stellaceae bacterium]|nr:glycine cleavage system aminomethyltransferase GcvT [Stellaceae bacterium]
MAELSSQPLQRTPLYELHRSLGAKLVPFAGYEMPVQYPQGILAEHLHTRSKAGLFDVSHMGQVKLSGAAVAEALETLCPGDIRGLGAMRQRYTLFTNEAGGILDDLMVTNAGDHLFVVVNAACKAADIAHLEARIGARAKIEVLGGRALLALQGPAAAAVMARLAPETPAMTFMTAASASLAGIPCFLTRSGYTGEDGFEISVPADRAEALARRLLAEPEVAPIGLGARDSLRLEAGLCLYGHDIDTTTTVIEADLAWAFGKRRRVEGGFPGAAVLQRQLAEGAPRKRVGILPEGRAPAREHTEIVAGGRRIGEVTSGGFGPSVNGPIAMGYVETAFAAPGTAVELVVRGTPRPAKIVKLPFVAPRYHRGA